MEDDDVVHTPRHEKAEKRERKALAVMHSKVWTLLRPRACLLLSLNSTRYFHLKYADIRQPHGNGKIALDRCFDAITFFMTCKLAYATSVQLSLIWLWSQTQHHENYFRHDPSRKHSSRLWFLPRRNCQPLVWVDDSTLEVAAEDWRMMYSVQAHAADHKKYCESPYRNTKIPCEERLRRTFFRNKICENEHWHDRK